MRFIPYSKLNIRNFIKQGMLLDTNILYLFLVGLYDNRHNTNFLRPYNYNTEDFECLTTTFSSLCIKKFIITPHVLTQFCYQIQRYLKGNNLNKFLEEFLPNLKEIHEKSVEKNRILDYFDFKKLGLTDVSLILASEDFVNENKKTSVVLDDMELAARYNKSKEILAFTLHDLKSFRYTFS